MGHCNVFTADGFGGKQSTVGIQAGPDAAESGGESGADSEAGNILARGAGAVQNAKRAPGRNTDPVRDSGQKVQQGQEASERLPAEVSPLSPDILRVTSFQRCFPLLYNHCTLIGYTIFQYLSSSDC